ncbi:MAG TPA: hypothetical protein VFE42_20710 [Chloroflexota bacterium]|nr:hypothetical protein [Chloroflexota bacterium]HZS89900.1 hypothetical protein [Chloroflexota bacterium]
MVKIIRHGQEPRAERHWLYERDVSCPHCGTVFRAEEGDAYVQVLAHARAAVHCPVCHGAVEVEPAPTQEQGAPLDVPPAPPAEEVLHEGRQ